MSWRITGTEQLDGDDPRPPGGGRRADVRWDDEAGRIVVKPGSEWVPVRLRELDGQEVMIAPVGPVFTVDLTNPASAFWATWSLMYALSLEVENAPDPVWVDDTPPGSVN